MKFLSLFSGIEACSVAWKPLGWECVGFSEIEPFPCSLLAHHYPHVPNLGDITKITEQQIADLGNFDLVVFGFPCQEVSAAGSRVGFDGNRSVLFYEALRIFDYARKHNNCRFAMFENVPGIFSVAKGEVFATVVREMAGLQDVPIPPHGWGNSGVALGENGLLEWRVLDAQYFGLAQRRKRVFAILDTGNWYDRPPILFEQESVRGDTPPSRETGSETPTNATAGAGECSEPTLAFQSSYNNVATKEEITPPILAAQGTTGNKGVYVCHGSQSPINNADELANCLGTNNGTENVVCFEQRYDKEVVRVVKDDVSPTLTAGMGTAGTNYVYTAYTVHADPTPKVSEDVSGTLRSQGGGGIVPPNVVYGFQPRLYSSIQEATPTLCATDYKDPMTVVSKFVVRRLTPTECERLQGFPNGYTDIPHNGKPASKSARYKALGNSMATNVMKYIGQQIQNAVNFNHSEEDNMKHPIKGGFSPTHIQTYFTCPYQYYAKYITREVKFTDNPHAQFGTAVHKNIEDYLNGDGKLSPYLEKLRPTLDRVKGVMVGAETKLCITKWNTHGKSFFDVDTHLKCIVDCVAISADGKTVVAFDWKTGKKSDAQVQHDIIKRCLQVYYPEATEIITCFWYFVKGAIDIQHHKRGKALPDLDDKIAVVERSHKTGEFPYTPNGLCKKWCDVLSCPHNGRS